jgi:hypothetical protein
MPDLNILETGIPMAALDKPGPAGSIPSADPEKHPIFFLEIFRALNGKGGLPPGGQKNPPVFSEPGRDWLNRVNGAETDEIGQIPGDPIVISQDFAEDWEEIQKYLFTEEEKDRERTQKAGTPDPGKTIMDMIWVGISPVREKGQEIPPEIQKVLENIPIESAAFPAYSAIAAKESVEEKGYGFSEGGDNKADSSGIRLSPNSTSLDKSQEIPTNRQGILEKLTIAQANFKENVSAADKDPGQEKEELLSYPLPLRRSSTPQGMVTVETANQNQDGEAWSKPEGPVPEKTEKPFPEVGFKGLFHNPDRNETSKENPLISDFQKPLDQNQAISYRGESSMAETAERLGWKNNEGVQTSGESKNQEDPPHQNQEILVKSANETGIEKQRVEKSLFPDHLERSLEKIFSKDQPFSIKQAGPSTMEVVLEPEGLGRMDIELNFSNDRIQGQILVNDQAGKDLLERNLPQLLSDLTREGLQIGGFTVSLKNHGRENQRGREPVDGKGSNPSPPLTESIPSVAGNQRVDIII